MKKNYKEIQDIPKKEIDEPLKEINTSKLPLTDNLLKQNKLDKNLFNTIKGHNLLGWCLGILFCIYFIEIVFLKGKFTEISKTVIEIIKLIIFSLMGYLFGTNGNENR